MSDSAHGRFFVRRRLSLFPRLDEPISPEFYRFTGKVRVGISLTMILFNLLGILSADAMGYDGEFYTVLQLPVNGLALLDVTLALILWRRRGLSERAMWRLALAGALVELTTVLVAAWAFGSVGSHFVLFGVITCLTYRIGFDFAIGGLATAYWVLGHWAIVIAEAAGWLANQPLYGDAPVIVQRHMSALVLISFVTLMAFIVANWTVARLRHKEIAIRILRQTLAATGEGRIGRHTGSTLSGTYDVGPLLGSGGMGEVYRGVHQRTQRKVAIKILHPHLVDDEVLMRRFRREAEVTGQLGSRNIVEVIDVDRDNDTPFMVLELLEGQDLASRLAERGALPPDEAADVLDQVAAGLGIAHEAGIVHRDLKPENLFLCHQDGARLVKILDFVISKIRGNATALTHEVALIGTPDYMSPEQATAMTEEVDARTDIFALGGIAYTCVSGQRPFTAGSVPALLRRICDEEPPALEQLCPDLPRAVIDVIALAMAKDPDERYATVSELRADLAAAFAGTLDPAVSQRALAIRRGRPASQTQPSAIALAHDTTVVGSGSGADEVSGTEKTVDRASHT